MRRYAQCGRSDARLCNVAAQPGTASTLPPVGGEGRPPSRQRVRTGWGGDFAGPVAGGANNVVRPDSAPPPPPPPPPPLASLAGEGSAGFVPLEQRQLLRLRPSPRQLAGLLAQQFALDVGEEARGCLL